MAKVAFDAIRARITGSPRATAIASRMSAIGRTRPDAAGASTSAETAFTEVPACSIGCSETSTATRLLTIDWPCIGRLISENTNPAMTNVATSAMIDAGGRTLG